MSRKRAKQEKGQARVQELTEMFPELPRQHVVAVDYRREGLRHTPVLDEIGRWAWPDAHDHEEFDYDEHSPEELVGGVSRTPKHICFGQRGEQWIMLDSRSPYEVKYEGGGRYWLYRDEEPIEEAFFIPCPQWFWKKTSRGMPMNLVLNSNFERRFGVYLTTYCEYFKDDNQCRFCNMNPTVDHFVELGRRREPVKREQDVYETYLAYAQETQVEAIALIAGSFYDRSKEADLFLRYIEVVKRAMRDSGCHVERILLAPQAMEEGDQQRLKEAGVTEIQHNLELWDPKLFEILCPGKAKNVGRERWIESLVRGAEIFGWGKVATNFVLGAEMIPPFGFKTEEEAAASVVEGYQYMISHGVSVANIFFRPEPGANLGHALRPRTEYFLRMEVEIDKLHKEYSLANASPFCRSRSAPAVGRKGQS